MADRDVTYEYDIDPDETNNTAATILRLARGGEGRVLDLGSGPGVVSSVLARDGRDVTCVDTDPALLELAHERGVARTIVADLEDPAWVERVPDGPFGTVILGDVLEHLRDPGQVLETVREHSLLAEDGFLVISVPNVAHEAVIAGLLGGRFEYTDTGLLDATHIHFFTHDSLHSLLERTGFLVTRLERTTRTLEQTEQFAQIEFIEKPLREAMRDHLREVRTYQFIVRAEPMDHAHRLAQLREEAEQTRQQRIRDRERLRQEHQGALADLTAQLEEARRDAIAARERLNVRLAERDEVIAAQSADLVALRTEKDREVGSARDQLASLEALRQSADSDRQRLQAETQRLQREVDRLQAKVDSVYESETWRLGRALTWPLRAAQGKTGRGRRSRSGPPSRRHDDDARPHRRRRYQLAEPFPVAEDARVRERYEAALGQRAFERPDTTHVMVTVSTLDLDAGRGDLYTALGLGLALEEHGYEFVYATEEQWYDPPAGTQVVLSLLAEPKLMLDPRRVPSGCLLVAWIRNNTVRWTASAGFELYDAVLCSSEATEREVSRAYDGPTGILRIGVDRQLFAPADGPRRDVVTTVNQWGRERATYAALRAGPSDFPLAIYGTQREFPEELEPYRRGPLSYFSIPSLYAQAAIVLDDQQDVNRPYGNVNSRIFESLAVGSLPVTNTAVGSALHLEALPVYDSPEEMHRLVADLLADEPTRAELVAELQAAVLEHHTYEHRATELHEFLTSHDLHGGGRPERGVLTFQPDYRATNPYQDLLYQQCRSVARVAVSSPGEVLSSPQLIGRRGIHHVHWTATILGPATSRRDAEDRCDGFLRELDQLTQAGWAIVWTVHNLMPHECAYPEVERRLRQGLADRAAAVHVMCERTVGLARPDYILPEDRVVVIPHGSYLDVYPRIVDRAEARRRLGLPPAAPVVTCFGQVRPYKGIERLLDAFAEARTQEPELTLLVAGGVGRFEGARELAERLEGTPGVVAHLEVVPDDEVQLHMVAADAVVLPHERVLNSGGALLALSFGRGVIAPRVGCLQDLINDEIGVLFEPDGAGLAEALATTRRLGVDDVQEAATKASETWTHLAMADAFRDLVAGLAGASRQVAG